MSDCIFYVERNIHGAWAVCGLLGIRQYYDYTKAEAIQKYIAECKRTLLVEE